MPPRLYTHAFATLRFSAEFLNPADVTRAIWLPPDHVHRKGELIRTKGTRKAKTRDRHREGLWTLSSEGCVNVPELDTNVRWLLGLLEPRAEAVASLLAQGVNAVIWCHSRGLTGKAPALSRDVRRRVAALGIALVGEHFRD